MIRIRRITPCTFDILDDPEGAALVAEACSDGLAGRVALVPLFVDARTFRRSPVPWEGSLRVARTDGDQQLTRAGREARLHLSETTLGSLRQWLRRCRAESGEGPPFGTELTAFSSRSPRFLEFSVVPAFRLAAEPILLVSRKPSSLSLVIDREGARRLIEACAEALGGKDGQVDIRLDSSVVSGVAEGMQVTLAWRLSEGEEVLTWTGAEISTALRKESLQYFERRLREYLAGGLFWPSEVAEVLVTDAEELLDLYCLGRE